jgi:ribosome-associated toxin RatA of RatAB toxin-antitoxin module
LQVVERSAIVTFSPAQMFALVNDVASYPEFLPWCADARVLESSAGERVATVKVARGMLRMQFTTRNTLQPDSQILMQLIEGPFSHLVGRWDFTAIGDRGSSIRFRIEFEFSNRLAAAAVSPVFKSLCDSIVDAFVLRAQQVHRPEPRA